MKSILIRLLFWLLDVDLKCKNLVPFDDLKSIAGENKATEIDKAFRETKYIQALSAAYHVPNLNEWLYLQVVNKRNEHIKTLDKSKRDAQRAAMLTFLRIIEEMRDANEKLINLRRRK